MAVFKCKMCGGSLEPAIGETVCQCEYCGTSQTIPRADDERLRQLFERANNFRLKNEFDSGAMVYENILTEYPEEAEAYWGMCLCRYGIEYVKDPVSGKMLATCHRTQLRSVLEDPDYAMALRYADGAAESVYREEAGYINAVQRKILEISRKEEPFDIFICYKETDAAGDRSTDSVVAQDIYESLTKNGYRVFFSRITLEDKLGQEYEPYIFAALNSAEIMLVIGTKPENFNAVWVKNEWSRFLKLGEQGASKTIIPCYRDMSPYDLPPELRGLQSQDVSKIGYMQDLLRGIKKLTGGAVPVNTPVMHSAESFIQRAMLFLEDKNYSQALIYCEKALDVDPKNAQAYLTKLMAELRLSHEEQLMNVSKPIGNMASYEKAYRFAGDTLKRRLCTYEMNSRYLYADSLLEEGASRSTLMKALDIFTALGAFNGAAEGRERTEKMIRDVEDQAYSNAKALVEKAENGKDYIAARNHLEETPPSARSNELIAVCNEQLERLYQRAAAKMSEAVSSEDFAEAQRLFEDIVGYKDAGAMAFKCSMRYEDTSDYERESLEAERRRNEAAILEKQLIDRVEINQKKERKSIKTVITTGVIAAIAAVAVSRNVTLAQNSGMVFPDGRVGISLLASLVLVGALIIIEIAVNGSFHVFRWKWQKLSIAGIIFIMSMLMYNTMESLTFAAVTVAAHIGVIALCSLIGGLILGREKHN